MTQKPKNASPGRHLAPYRAFLAPGALGLVAAVLEAGGDPVRLALRVERDGIASGELWRLITGHLVHLGPSHMAMNVIALGVMAVIFRRQLENVDWLAAALLAALFIDAGLILIGDSVNWYVGLSGVLHGLWAAACVKAWLTRRSEAWLLSLLLIGKLGYESVHGPSATTTAIADGPVIAVAHAYGALGGMLWPFVRLATRKARASL